MGEYCIFADNHGVLGLPTYLLVTLVVAAAILAVFSFSLVTLWNDTQLYQVSRELDKLVTEAEAMFEYADEGTIVTMNLELPSSLHYVVFGGLPTSIVSEPASLSRNETTSNNYYFVMDNGQFQTFHTHARFADKTISQVVLLYQGSYDVRLELVKYGGKTYVTISSP